MLCGTDSYKRVGGLIAARLYILCVFCLLSGFCDFIVLYCGCVRSGGLFSEAREAVEFVNYGD